MKAVSPAFLQLGSWYRIKRNGIKVIFLDNELNSDSSTQVRFYYVRLVVYFRIFRSVISKDEAGMGEGV